MLESKKRKSCKKKPLIIPRAMHNVTRANISKNALAVLYRLKSANYQSYLVGGGVRDLLVGLKPKDFDIATDARPEEIKRLFRNCRLIGRRFRLAHIYFGSEIIEVATFRGEAGNEASRMHSDSGMILRDNVYGTLEEDAWRRDFTVNALYYNIADFSLVDFTGGMKDINKKLIKVIGDPGLRYHEDPVRMLRAIRLAAKLDFTVAPETAKLIPHLVGLLQNVAASRLFDEINKWFRGGRSLETFEFLKSYGLFAALFPQTEARLVGDDGIIANSVLTHGFRNTDARIRENKTLNQAFLFAVLLWWPLQHRMDYYIDDGHKLAEALHLASHDVLAKQSEHISIPNRDTLLIKEVWLLQYRLLQRRKKKISSILNHPKFRAAYDFLLLREQSGEDLAEVAAWWSKFIVADGETQKMMVEILPL